MSKTLFNKRAPFRIAVLISGRGSNLAALINAKGKNQIQSELCLVLSNKPDALGLEKAKQANIATKIVPSKGKDKKDFELELVKSMQESKPDLVVLAGFMRVLSGDFLHKLAVPVINIHPSLLPAFPGLNAQKQAVESGAKISGCTVHFVDEGCDTGPILLQKSLEITPEESPEDFAERLLPLEHQSLVNAIQILEGNEVVLQGKRTLLRRRNDD
ncbi:MAG: phosphoribosylglycinamide formyltransferase [Deltaproteobacteria bacterium]|nr:phosphoribosylglycinamide formyltransferase [Deltaproteobacteria bacterium]